MMVTFLTNVVTETFSDIPLSSYVAVVVWIAANIVQVVLMKKKKIYNSGQRKIDKAVADGHVVYAKLDRIVHKGHRSGSNYNEYRGIYTYTVNGKEYRKDLLKDSRLFKDPLKLYYVRNPNNAKTAGEMRGWSEQVLPVLVPLAIASLVYSLLM